MGQLLTSSFPTSLFVLFTSLVNPFSVAHSGEVVQRGYLSELNQIECVTGRSPFDYNNYGCYCGIGGAGVPVDDIDRCCQLHDQCYGRLEHAGLCSRLEEYLGGYEWKCVRKMSIWCPSIPDQGANCGHHLCECDSALAECLSRQSYRQKRSCTDH